MLKPSSTAFGPINPEIFKSLGPLIKEFTSIAKDANDWGRYIIGLKHKGVIYVWSE